MSFILIALAFTGHDLTVARVERYATQEACEREQVRFLDANAKARADCVPADRVTVRMSRLSSRSIALHEEVLGVGL